MSPSVRTTRAIQAALSLLVATACGGGGGDGGTAPPVVASVVIDAPLAARSFQTLTRTAQYAAVARDASAATIAGAAIAWNSSVPAVATVSGTGLVTAVGNGTTQLTASSAGVTSTPVTITVTQVVGTIGGSTGAIAFGAIGSTRQLSAGGVDSSGAAVPGAPAPVWSRAGDGLTASVSVGGLVTALAVGTSDTAVVTVGALSVKRPIVVTQVPANIVVSPAGTDTLRTTGRTKQYTAAASDSNGNAMPGAAITWSSSATGTATVNANTGLATAVADGSASIIASSGGFTGQRTLVVRRYASTFTITPPTATITTPLGTQIFLGTAQDSVPTNLPITWVVRPAGVVGLSGGSGAQVTATAATNGSAYVVMQAGTRIDSALVTVTGQVIAPSTATVIVGNNFFRSNRNNTQNAAIDTVAVGGTVTWQHSAGTHSVESQGAPSFPSSATFTSGSYVFTFTSAGTYEYICAIHGAGMSGRVIVR